MITSSNCTLSALKKVKLTPPDGAGQWWGGVAHSDMVQAFLDALKEEGVGDPRSARIVVSNMNLDMIAAFDLGPLVTPGVRATVAVETSNGRHKSPRAYLGVMDTVVNCGIVFQEVPMGKLTTGFDPKAEALSVVRAAKRFAFGKEVERYRKKHVPPEAASLVTMEVGRLKYMPWSRVGRVDAMFRNSTNQSAYDLALAFSKVCQMNPPRRQLRELAGFARLVEKAIFPAKVPA